MPRVRGRVATSGDHPQDLRSTGEVKKKLQIKVPTLHLHKDLRRQRNAFFDVLCLLVELLAELVDGNASL